MLSDCEYCPTTFSPNQGENYNFPPTKPLGPPGKGIKNYYLEIIEREIINEKKCPRRHIFPQPIKFYYQCNALNYTQKFWQCISFMGKTLLASTTKSRVHETFYKELRYQNTQYEDQIFLQSIHHITLSTIQA